MTDFPPPAPSAHHLLLNESADVSDRMTVLVVSASKAAAASVVGLLRQAALFDAGGGRRAVHVGDVVSLMGRRGLRRFSAPRLIVISHDPVTLAEELGADNGDMRLGVRRAKHRLGVIFKLVLQSNCPVLVLSQSLAESPPLVLAAIVAPFCGIATPSIVATPAPTTAAPVGMQRGVLELRRAGVDDHAGRTIIVGGPPRSGTSMIAAVLHAAGLPFGADLVASTFENTMHNILFKPSTPRTWKSVLTASWGAAIVNPRHVRLAWDGFDLPRIKALVAARRRDGPVWGFKRPAIGSFIRLGGLRLLDEPRVILSLRDPVGTTARIAQAHDVAPKVALRIASWFLLDSLETACACRAPTLLVSHDAAKRDLQALIERILPFCGLTIDAGRHADIRASVERAGAAYRADFAAPLTGEIMGILDDEIFGWAAGGPDGPVVVEILADDRKIASGLADQVADDGQLVFVIGLPIAALTHSTRIRAVVLPTQSELRNSGLTLDELRRS